MPAPTRKAVVRASALVLAVGVNLLFITLLVASRARVTPEPIAAAMIWMVLEQSRTPQHRPARQRVRRDRAGTAERSRASLQSSADTSIQLPPAPESPEVEASGTQPPVDWALESQLAAERSVANQGRAGAFSAAPVTGLAAGLCKPRIPSPPVQAQMDQLLPPPPEPHAGAGWPPAGSVKLAGNVVVQFLKFSVPLGKRSAEAKPIPKDRIRSSVPDANDCD